MDDSDRATEREERDRSLAMAYRKPAPSACGACYNCNEPVKTGRIFCCAECREDYELREKMKGIRNI
jgi:hypothetical protein